ncbi:hypothetical protein Tsubulata_044202 [Turnera subulata]|uniref:Cytochrome P450 n=1 Tax=Turnera subulata TaxID=218843 RepID=A0A9Q0GLZ3_9ROSI|nr:hypothetical protein Tsubulata_044202 [Turnera subulata]
MILMISSTLMLLLVSTIFIITKILKARLSPNPHHAPPPLPPGSLGWPVIGETMELLRTGRDTNPEKFAMERVEKYGSQLFKTSVLGEKFIFFCGPAENKFLFSNENKMVISSWWPNSIKKLFKSCLINAVGDEARMIKRILMNCLNQEALKRYIGRMDSLTQHHISTQWHGKEEVKVYATVQLYTFELACSLFASIDDPAQLSRLSAEFDVFLKGVIALPFNMPGTRFYRATRAANVIRDELLLIARQRKVALDKEMVSSTQDLVSHMLVTKDASGRQLSEMEIVDNTLLLLFAGHDTTRSAITSVMKYLGELPEVYAKVLEEQTDIAKSKEPGELLKWEDIQKMRYSWNVVSEVLRLSPPVRGGFREAIADFTYAGYTIPKGWKVLITFSCSLRVHMRIVFDQSTSNIKPLYVAIDII